MEITHQDWFDAIKKGDRQQAARLLAEDPALVQARDASGLSGVLLALYYGQPALADLLIEHGAVLNIFEAAAAGQTQRVREIVEQDPAQVNAFAADGFQPLGLAAFFGQMAVVELLLANGAEVSRPSQNNMRVQPLHSAAAGSHLEIVRALLDHGADANARQAEDFTALHSAAQNGQAEMIRLLLAHGADPRARAAGKTPANLAREAGHAQVLDLLG